MKPQGLECSNLNLFYGSSIARMDVHTKAQRSYNMSRIRSINTKPELVVRKLCHAMGYRFRLHRKDLPGTPDLVFVRYKIVIFVNGCF